MGVWGARRALLPVAAILALLSSGVAAAGAGGAVTDIGGRKPESVDVSGPRVVYADRRDGAYSVLLYDGVTGSTTRVNDPSVNALQPSVAGPLVAYTGWSAGSADVYLYDAWAGDTRVISGAADNQVSPSVSSRWVVWEDHRTTYSPQIWAHDLDTGSSFRVDSGYNVPKRRPRVAGDIVVWQDWAGQPAGRFDSDVKAYDLAAGRFIAVADSTRNEVVPETDGRWIVWAEEGPAGDLDIRAFDTESRTYHDVCVQPGEQTYPVVHDGVAYWVDASSGSTHVDSRRLGGGDTAHFETYSTGSVTALAAGEGGVAWLQGEGARWRVRAALPRSGLLVGLARLVEPLAHRRPVSLARVAAREDDTPPRVLSTSVEPGQLGVEDDSFAVYFSEPLDPASVNASSVSLVEETSGETVEASVSYSALARAVTVRALEPLEGTYRLVVRSSVADEAGNRLAAPAEATFATGPELADVTPPTRPQKPGARVDGLSGILVGWEPSFDSGSGVAEYLVYRMPYPGAQRSLVTTVAGENTSVSVPEDGDRSRKYTTYFSVRARDAAGNLSAFSGNAPADPHGTYVLGADTDTCLMCHRVHGAADTGALGAKSAGACYECHGKTNAADPPDTDEYGHASTLDAQAAFGDDVSVSTGGPDLPGGPSMHRNPAMSAGQRECVACHTAHRKPYNETDAGYDPATSYGNLLRGNTAKTGSPYSTDAATFGNGFCFGCHGSGVMTYMNETGGAQAYDNAGGDHETGFAASAHNEAAVLSTLGAPGKLQANCTACHNEHASPNNALIDYRQSDTAGDEYAGAGICFACHSSTSTESRSAGTKPFTWWGTNRGDVEAEFRRASSHPVDPSGFKDVPVFDATFHHTTQAQFDTYTRFQTVTNAADGDGSIVLGTTSGTFDPPPQPLLFAHKGGSAYFDQYKPADDAWNTMSFDPADGNAPGSGSSAVWVPSLARLYVTRGAASTNMWYYTPPADSGNGTWTNAPATQAAVGVGGDNASDLGNGFVYFTRANNTATIMKWRASDQSWQTAITFRDSGGTTRNLGAGSAVAYAPGADRLFVLDRNGGANDGRLYYVGAPSIRSGNVDFTQGVQVVRSDGTTRYNRMAHFRAAGGEEFLMIIGADTGGAGDTMVMTTLAGTPAKMELTKFPFPGALGDGCGLVWDGVDGGYLYAVRGGNTTGFARIAIPEDPSLVGDWGDWEALTGPEALWSDATPWEAGASIAFAEADPEPFTAMGYFTFGTATTGYIDPHPSANRWGELAWTAEVAAETAIEVKVQDASGFDVPGYTGLTESPVDLSALTTAAYPRIRLVAALISPTGLSTPRLDEWSVSSVYTQEVPSGALACVNCHNVHAVRKGTAGSVWQTSRVSDPDDTKSPAPATVSEFCLKCHDGVAPARAFSATKIVPYSPVFTAMSSSPFFPGWNKAQSGLEWGNGGHAQSRVTRITPGCESCHDPHASDNPRLTAATAYYVGGSAPAGHVDARRDNTSAYAEERLCYVCHLAKRASPSCTGGACHPNLDAQPDMQPDVETPFSQVYRHPVELSGRHSDTEGPEELGASNRHAECVDCHDPHATRPGRHAQGSSVAGEVLRGAIGVRPSYDGGEWTAATGFTAERMDGGSTDYEAYLCFKCHSSYSGQPFEVTSGSGTYVSTDLALELNPANESGHNVAGDVWPKTAGLGASNNRTWSLPNDTAWLRTGWTRASMLTCSDCHTWSGTGAKGPHGTSTRFLIDSAYAGDYQTAYINRGSTNGVSSNVICSKCHVNFHTMNNAHREHGDRGSRDARCTGCHVKIPHGWKRPRLLGYRGDPEPYRALYLNNITDKNYSGSWNKNDCGQTGCGSHNTDATSPYWP
ncbi:MAG: Ig-like domain-containing protein [Coriobacteriia bacterium]|nr:Ig-like domain-containing protein [Coriobacteriia bacterium]